MTGPRHLHESGNAADPAPLPGAAPGEVLRTTFAAGRAAYWRAQLIMAALGGAVAGLALVVTGDPHPWVGPVGAIAAILGRGAYLASEVLGMRWQLTSQRLILPDGRSWPLSQIRKVRPLLGEVQVVLANGDKHLIRHPDTPAAVIHAITTAQAEQQP